MHKVGKSRISRFANDNPFVCFSLKTKVPSTDSTKWKYRTPIFYKALNIAINFGTEERAWWSDANITMPDAKLFMELRKPARNYNSQKIANQWWSR